MGAGAAAVVSAGLAGGFFDEYGSHACVCVCLCFWTGTGMKLVQCALTTIQHLLHTRQQCMCLGLSVSYMQGACVPMLDVDQDLSCHTRKLACLWLRC